MKLRNNRGDTIVEVLIAVAIVSLTLAAAFTSANKSANATRTAQERGEALKWAETQVEQIKATTVDLSTGTYSAFCFDTNLTLRAGAATCNTNTPIPYRATVTQSSQGNFSVVVTWDAINSSTPNKVELGYTK